MSAGKSPARAKASARRLSYRQGAKTISVESLAHVWAVRYEAAHRAAVEQALNSFGSVQELPPQRLCVIELASAARRDELLAQLEQLRAAGQIEFFQPVLRDPVSKLHQILTDEISVRFKKAPSAKQLKAVERKYGVRVAHQNEFVPRQFIVQAAPAREMNTLEVASQLDAADEVEFAAPNFISEYKR